LEALKRVVSPATFRNQIAIPIAADLTTKLLAAAHKHDSNVWVCVRADLQTIRSQPVASWWEKDLAASRLSAGSPNAIINCGLNGRGIVGATISYCPPIPDIDNLTKPLWHRPSSRGSSCGETEVCKSCIGLRRGRQPRCEDTNCAA